MPFSTNNSSLDKPSQHSVLIVNPSEDICLGLTDRLTARGYHVESAHDGRMCLDRIRQRVFSAVLVSADLLSRMACCCWTRFGPRIRHSRSSFCRSKVHHRLRANEGRSPCYACPMNQTNCMTSSREQFGFGKISERGQQVARKMTQ
jgi:hypothetical protein